MVHRLRKARVSIQPKPKKGLEAEDLLCGEKNGMGFNPAEAEEGFRRGNGSGIKCFNKSVSIQPKPKKGLEGS